MAKQSSSRSKPKKPQASPYSLFFAAFLAFLFGAPIAIVIFLVVIGVILWRIRSAAQNMAKLPPLPPREQQAPEDGELANRQQPYPESTDDPLTGTTWGRKQDTGSDTGSGSSEQPQASRASRTDSVTPYERPEPDYPATIAQIPPPEPVSRPVPPIVVPPATNQARHRSPAPASAMTPAIRGTSAGLGVNLASRQGLRQAIVAMTILGPCRALDPYSEDPRKSGLPGGSAMGDRPPPQA